MATDPPDDFDPKSAFIKLSASLEQPDKFAELFCAAAKKQKDIDNVLKETIRSLLQHDNEARTQIKGLLKEIEKEEWRFFLKKGGAAGIVFVSLLTGALLNAVTRHAIESAPTEQTAPASAQPLRGNTNSAR